MSAKMRKLKSTFCFCSAVRREPESILRNLCTVLEFENTVTTSSKRVAISEESEYGAALLLSSMFNERKRRSAAILPLVHACHMPRLTASAFCPIAQSLLGVQSTHTPTTNTLLTY